MKDLMIDLETLGTKPESVVLSIGAVLFDTDKGKIGDTFYSTLNITDQMNVGRRIDTGTLRWWLAQSTDAKKAILDTQEPTDVALERFIGWLKAKCPSDVYPWGNGSTFDISIMESLLNDFQLDVPWKYSHVMDLRTFRRFNGRNQKVINLGVSHNALDDALAQAKYIIQFTGGNNK